ncbi:hypothetical protein RRG08_027778 [Elysia crispata]|uniref:Uncharacterized protein n=1 Tax=Elysia crispata TaxID=231223 RepID=A0AAE0Z9C8_9GAST|nr:hypothetical protein RRG08_027778 [Elysia crispata]
MSQQLSSLMLLTSKATFIYEHDVNRKLLVMKPRYCTYGARINILSQCGVKYWSSLQDPNTLECLAPSSPELPGTEQWWGGHLFIPGCHGNATPTATPPSPSTGCSGVGVA